MATGIFFHSFWSKPGASNWLSDSGSTRSTASFWVIKLLGHHVGGDEDRRLSRALAAARLQHEQTLVLNGELEILHVLVVLLEPRGDVAQLLEGLRHHLLELANMQRRADAGYHVFALRVEQKFAVELVGTGGRVAGEAHACARAVAGVAEHHHLDVHGRANVIRNVVDAAYSCARGFIQERTPRRAPSSAAQPAPAETADPDRFLTSCL